MSEWAHLPNARHIDWVIDSITQHAEIWAETYDSNWNVGRVAAYNSAYDMTWDAARYVRLAVHVAVRLAAGYGCEIGVRIAARYSGEGATLALIAYDDCATLLDMPSEKLRAWALLSEQPAAVLLLPAVIAREQIRELNMT